MPSSDAVPDVAVRLPRLCRAVRNRLLPWFHQHQRRMPWRSRRSAYRVWVSEIMLQQTRVDTVRPYFRRFMKRFPSVRALAEAPLEEVLKQWEGLGYYARARNMHLAAKRLVEEHGGRFPRSYEGLRKMPGVGSYTAAAIGSLVMGLDVAVVDGNVIRVLTRLLACAEDVGEAATRRRLQTWAEALLVPGRAGEVNEAMMELGATVCTSRSPSCPVCPLRATCMARAEGDVETYPVKTRKGRVPHKEVGAGLIVNRRGQFLVAQRRTEAMLGGLWEFPGGGQESGESMADCIRRELKEELGIGVRVGPHFCTVPHAFSHFTMNLHAYWVRIEKGRPRTLQCNAYQWTGLEGIRRLPLPRADLHILAGLEEAVIPDF